MATAGQSKVKEGDKLILEAEKCLKTSWLKWTQDYIGASAAFDKAGLCYRNAKAYDRARIAYERAAEAHYKNASPFQAGRSLEQAAHATKELQQVEQAAMLLERASTYYHESGNGDTAGQVLTKAAKLLDATNPRKAADYHLACAELHLIEDKEREAAKATRVAVNMCARSRDLDKLRETVEKLRRLYEDLQQHKQLWNVTAIEVVLHLHLDDTVAAKDTLREGMRVPGFPESDEAAVLERLCEAFSERDGEAVAKACSDIVFRSMDSDIAKLAKDLKNKFIFPSPTHSPAHVQPQANTQPSTTTTPATATPAGKPANLSDMKSELFGGSARKEKAPEMKTEGFSGTEEREEGRGGGESSGGREGEPSVTDDQLAEGEEEEEEEEDTYGGMLT